MNIMSALAGAAQIGGVALGAPLVVGAMRQVRARSEGRVGGGVGQPWRDLRKQLRKRAHTQSLLIRYRVPRALLQSA